MVEHQSVCHAPVRAPLRGPRLRARKLVAACLAVLAVTTVLVAAPFSVGAPRAGAAVKPAATTSAYWLVAADGGIFGFGGAPFDGSMGGHALNRPIVGMTPADHGAGYWEVASDGGIFSFGKARFYGSTGALVLNKPVVGMTARPDGSGYWLVASDGGIFAFGSASFFGSMGAHPLNRPIVGMAATPDGKGYWLVAADGGIFAFGDAHFYGSTGSITLNEQIVAMAATPSGHGYWFTASDGGVFSFGDAGFYGSLGGVPQQLPVVAMSATKDGGGYWFTNSNGAVTAYGDAVYWGSAPQVLAAPVVGMAIAPGNGHFPASPYPSASVGYDVSNFQCGNYPPAPHTIGVVQVVGESFGSTNPCLGGAGGEAAWAGAGLNLYVFLTFGLTNLVYDAACKQTASPDACNFGFAATLDAYQKAAAAGVDTAVAWWLDVEPYSLAGVPPWSGGTAYNDALIEGAIAGLRYVGINSVGIYASPGTWPSITGSYQPAVPYWAASWQVNPSVTCTSVRSQFSGARLPAGPIQIVQFASPQFPFPFGALSSAFDVDYAC